MKTDIVKVTSCANCPLTTYVCEQGFSGKECLMLPYHYDEDEVPFDCPLRQASMLIEIEDNKDLT